MTLRLTPLLLICLGLAAPAEAACFADYKAKQDQPLRLAYGVAELPDSACAGAGCGRRRAGPATGGGGVDTAERSCPIFGPEGLDERKASAGDHFLRY